MRNPKYIAAAFLIFVACLWFGFSIASHRILWNDERWTLTNSVLNISYTDIFAGHIQEGSNSPLFYALQKLQCSIFGYQPPADWPWEGKHLYSQIFLRAQSVAAIALAIALLFYYFARHYSWVTGIYAAIVALSSFMIWDHWAEARPYALWFLLTITQMLLLTSILKVKEKAQALWMQLSIVHVLLALTSSISMVQIIASSAVLWLFSTRQWRLYLGMALIPLSICLFYYTNAPRYDFIFTDGPLVLFNANIPRDRFLILLFFALVYVWDHFKKKEALSTEGKFFTFVGLTIVLFALVMIKLKATAATSGFQVSNRYFMPLTSVGIVGTILASIWLVRRPSLRFIQIAIIGILAAFLVFRVYRVIPFIKSSFYINGIL